MDVSVVQSNNRINCDNVSDCIKTFSKEAVELLKEKGLTVAIAESCTGGLVAKSITDISGSSNVFDCGVVSYSCDIKHKVLGVDEEMLKANGPVNLETAVQMAQGVRQLADANVGISTTGVAGPGPDGGHPEGEIYLGLATKTNSFVIKLETGLHDSREQNRLLATANVLSLLIDYLKEG